MKNTDYLSWDQYFMGIATLSAKRSKDPHTRVGAASLPRITAFCPLVTMACHVAVQTMNIPGSVPVMNWTQNTFMSVTRN